MCGIAGEFVFTEKGIVDIDNVIPMAQALSHRGPDEWGYHINILKTALLINTRLSIVDILGGRQPLTNEDGSIWMVCNGEIYNSKDHRKALEKKGHVFRTHSDVEVILHLYEEFGMSFVEHLRGEFAIAIYDNKLQKAYLVRDRFGIKPLYYSILGGSLIYASEIKSIFMHKKVELRELNTDHLYHTFNAVLIPGETAFKNIKQLKPGHILVFDQSKSDINIFKYWNIADHLHQSNVLEHYNEEDVIHEFNHLFRESVRLRLQGDVKIGAYLSGGLDSTAVVQTMLELSIEKFPTFTISFQDKKYDESAISTKYTREMGIENHILHVGRGDLAPYFIQSLWHSEIPVFNSHGTAKFLLSNLAQQHGIKAILTGEGADELLLGYSQFNHLILLEERHHNPGNKASNKKLKDFMKENGVLSGAISRASALIDFDEVVKLFGAYPYVALSSLGVQRKLNPFLSDNFLSKTQHLNSLEQLSDTIKLDTLKTMNSVALSQYVSFQTDLCSYILNYLGDRQEMAHSIEGRVPFLDHKLVEFVSQLPLELKIRGKQSKYLLRKAMQNAIPQNFDIKKKVFAAPSDQTLLFNEKNSLLSYYLSREATEKTNIFHPNTKFLKLALNALPKNSHLHMLTTAFLTMVLSVHILDDLFCKNFKKNMAYHSSAKEDAFDIHAGLVKL